jgi:uncharacterized membrane protein
VTEEMETPAVITDDDKLWALLCWIFAPLVPIIVLLLEDKKNRPFIRYNAMQGLIVGAAAVVLSGILGSLTFCIGSLIWPVIWIYQIYLGIQAYNGNWVEVPVVTDFAKNQGWI